MKFLAISDSHSDDLRIDLILDRHDDIKTIFHCGDYETTKEYIESKGIIAVNGNSKYDVYFDDEVVVEYEDEIIFITHGHLYNSRNLVKRAKELNATFCLFGHTHVIRYEEIDDLLVINPGSITRPYPGQEASYYIYDNGVSKFYDINGNLLHEFKRKQTIAK